MQMQFHAYNTYQSFTGEDLARLIEGVSPCDALELAHQKFMIEWILQGHGVWRLTPPDNPPRHFTCYFVPYDKKNHSFLLTQHIKAAQWLPAGGHVEEYEDPKITAIRECKEELKIDAKLIWDKPFFVSRTIHQHEDMSLWYAIEGHYDESFDFTRDEFLSVKWFTLESLPSAPFEEHLIRAMTKLKSLMV